MQNPIEIGTTLEIEHRVNVIRHHAPRMQVVPLAIEELKRARDDRGICIVAKNTTAVAFVEVGIQFQTEETIYLGTFSGIRRHSHRLLSLAEERDRDVFGQ